MANPRVQRRKIFYIPGYDPIHPRRYRELYRSEGRDQAMISGYSLALSPKQGKGPYGWHVDAEIDGAEIAADFEVMVWSDIVRGSMKTGILATYLAMIRTAWTYIASGALRRLMRLRKGPVIAALYPIFMLILQLLLAVGAGILGAKFLGWIWGLIGPDHWLATGAGALVGIAITYALLRWFKAQDNRFFVYYLMHDYSYSARSNGANPPELEARITDFKTRIAAALAEDVDEVLIVGHSSGAHLGVLVLSDLLRDGLPDNAPALGFLSLGQVVPMVSFLPDAWRLRADLQYLSVRDELAWVDVTAPGDGCAFALCDPVGVTGVAPEGQKWPLVFSAAFSQTLKPETWAKLKRRYFRLHFQYLCAFDQPRDYDYFQITAGPKTLRDRYDGRAPSKSRLTAPVSKYRSTDAAT